MKNLLLYRLYITNFCGFALVAWAAMLGYVHQVYANDISHISYVITALFVVGLGSTFLQAWRVNRAVDEVGEAPHLNLMLSGRRKATAARLPIGNAHLSDIAEWLVTLGLIGNVVGFVIALSGVDTSSLGTADGTQQVAAQLLAGMGVAFYSTLVGAVLALWTSINRRMLDTATARYVEDVK